MFAHTLLMLSGGIDSTFVAYDFLTKNPDKILLIHHINLINRENRNERESISVKNILQYFRDNKINNFKYTENTFDYGTMPFIIYDIEIAAFTIYMLLRNPSYQTVNNILLPYYMNKTAYRYDQHDRILANLNRPLNLIYPIKDFSKKEVIDKLPEELLNLTWFCRTPINHKPCKKCETCKEVFPCLKS